MSCSACEQYNNTEAIILLTDYVCGTTPLSSPPLPLIVDYEQPIDTPTMRFITQFNVRFQGPAPQFFYILNTFFDTTTNLWTGTLGDHSPELSVNFPPTGTVSIPCFQSPPEIAAAVQTTVRISGSDNIYFINLFACCGSVPGVSVTVNGKLQRTITSTGNTTVVDGPLVLCPCRCPNTSCEGDQFDDTEVNIPDITITAQTTLDGQNLGEVDFIIRDTINYHCSVAEGKCKERAVPTFKLIISCFQQFNPDLVKVIKGCGCTLAEKLNSLEPQPDFDAFVAYAMLKYILGRLLFGKFNINILYRKYHDQLIEDILNSRFCEFGRILLDPTKEFFGYDRYFKFDQCA